MLKRTAEKLMMLLSLLGIDPERKQQVKCIVKNIYKNSVRNVRIYGIQRKKTILL